MHTAARASLLSAVLVASSLSIAAAAPVSAETLVHDTTTNVEIELDDTTVLCSSADYGALFLKVLIPELAALTLLDHQNLGAGAPCVAAGMCEPGNMPDDILDPYDTKETVAIHVKALRYDVTDASAQTCQTSLVERVQVIIRGVDFFHERFAPLGERPYADCVSTVAPVDPLQPDGAITEKTDSTPDVGDLGSGGCNAGGGGPATGVGLLVLAVLALIAGTRRQRV